MAPKPLNPPFPNPGLAAARLLDYEEQRKEPCREPQKTHCRQSALQSHH